MGQGYAGGPLRGGTIGAGGAGQISEEARGLANQRHEPRTALDRLKRYEEHLEKELEKVQRARKELEEHPDIEKVIEALNSVGMLSLGI